MEGNRRTSKRHRDLIGKIRDFTRSLLRDLSQGRSPTIYIDNFRNYCTNLQANCHCSSDLPKGKEILTIKRECGVRRIDVLLRVLLIVQQLLQENKHVSKRDIYYMHPSVFSDQSIVDQAINDICILLHCSRHNLNVVGILVIYLSSNVYLVKGACLMKYCMALKTWFVLPTQGKDNHLNGMLNEW
ncbi:hypothetical protein JCGZ_01039 [Jatropha curcas]|uniref:Spo11/DNA topoisomerase VI subunit A N-terminal domain-containing protein n=1 Tax=Jatropha curcas TaxID=180498 RepID=A0A067KT35_JATCU|nr:hypothetical protein JCGZ_01039 [Jatropha curcas]